MYKARSSDESIGVAEALRYLRATKFNASKAIDVFKNYHVSVWPLVLVHVQLQYFELVVGREGCLCGHSNGYRILPYCAYVDMVD